MKPNIHPVYNMIDVQMTDGSVYKTRTTWGAEGDKLQLVIDPKNHPAYTGERRNIDTMGRIDKFKKKYASAAK
ncbi:MAG: 50S ribosomal protein L31 [Proteobacteria bacterium]|nr:50S ribosomal protein L31 [Pseudomonadota bacterium]